MLTWDVVFVDGVATVTITVKEMSHGEAVEAAKDALRFAGYPVDKLEFFDANSR